MNTQEAFDTMWDWFVVQGKPQAMEEQDCRYRTEDGNKCAVGCLVPDDIYHPDMERKRVQSIFICNHAGLEKVKSFLEGIDQEFLQDAQGYHDGWSWALERGMGPTFTEYMKARLLLLASRYNLTVPEINE